MKSYGAIKQSKQNLQQAHWPGNICRFIAWCLPIPLYTSLGAKDILLTPGKINTANDPFALAGLRRDNLGFAEGEGRYRDGLSQNLGGDTDKKT